MSKGFNLTNRAKEDLHGIWNYTFRNWSEGQADHYIAKLYERFEWLAERPDVGKHRPDIHEGFYCFPNRAHIVFYLIRENTIDIIGVLRKYMDVDSYFSQSPDNKSPR